MSEETMKTFGVSVPELGFVAATRAIAGVGIGLLLADAFEEADTRRAIGWALLGIGALTTIPIAFSVVSRYGDS
jgi:hydrogenase/urease accessory protein HupE